MLHGSNLWTVRYHSCDLRQYIAHTCLSQVGAFQEWRGALWALCHGALAPQGLMSTLAPSEDALAFVWLRLLRAVDGLCAALQEGAPGEAGLQVRCMLRAVRSAVVYNGLNQGHSGI